MRTGNSMLVAGVPADKGTPEHIEHDDNTAMTVFTKETVTELHTPQCVMRRTHEIMHARHTSPRRNKRQYAGVREIVWQVTEDCRLHLNFWPWRPGRTPLTIKHPTLAFVGQELENATRVAADPTKGPWPPFGTRLRAACVQHGVTGESLFQLFARSGMSAEEIRLAEDVCSLLRAKKPSEGRAARLIEAAFFPPQELPPPLDNPFSHDAGERIDTPKRGHGRQPPMQVIELAHDIAITDETEGARRVVSGPRLDRAMVRRPIMPLRCFLRRTPREPAGTILIDASGSMGDWEQVTQWCEKSPFATVAYYSGFDSGRGGWLYVYARDGFRASQIITPPSRGNCVDGPALTWLMNEPGPRVMVTDRAFCGAVDSVAQVLRLKNLEAAGEVTVRDYREDK